ncbi:hypothetical protein Vadar_021358 [Vaccinium darrowii]|uniref:Uncharacterized protein n=1 Tax=Vaccinium darrowii TaxID=229202 RepID=A0ACB7YF73_9ERIC|nr:hypothetical protein Vadar_021358 [Vaccinium darrowii]
MFSTALKHTASVVCVHILVYDEKQVLAKYLNMALATKRFLFLLIAVLVASTPAEAKKAKVTHIEFYMHDIVGGSNPTAVWVAGRASNFSSSDPIASMFGSIFVMDNPLTATPDLNSTLMGRAQGIYAMSSQHDEFSLLMTLTYNFISEAYNGSSFSVVGQNLVMREVREMPIVGGFMDQFSGSMSRDVNVKNGKGTNNFPEGDDDLGDTIEDGHGNGEEGSDSQTGLTSESESQFVPVCVTEC